MASQTRYYIKTSDAEAFAQSLLVKTGLSDNHASLMAKCLVQADTRGVDTHGMARLQQYMERVSRSLVNPTPSLTITERTPVAAHLDGDNGFGFIVASTAMADAVRRAQTYGIGIVTANHSNHFGMGKIRKAARRGEKIPLGWAYDADGKPTEDAEAALAGSMAPIGGPKGSGIAILMDVMAGVLSGAAFGGEVGDQYKEARPQNVGHCFVAIKPDVFMSADVFRARLDTLVQRVHAMEPAEGVEEVLFPGEPEHRLAVKRQVRGLPFADAEKDMFDGMARKYGVSPLAYSTTPLGS